MAGPHYFTRSFRLLKIDLKKLARGFTKSPVFTLDKIEKGFALQLQCINGTVFFIALGEGVSSFTFTVKDAEGSSMTRSVQVITSNDPALYDEKEAAIVSNAGVGNSEMASHIKMWPNPAKGQFNLLIPQTTKAMVVQIYNINGAMVGKAETVLPGITRSFNMTTPGTYLVTGTDKQSGEPIFVNKLVIK
jgi:hypothetical protein